MIETIEFEAQVARIQTMADGGLRFVFDTGEQFVMQAAQLMECKRFGIWLSFKLAPKEKEGQESLVVEQNRTSGRTKAKKRVQPGDSGV